MSQSKRHVRFPHRKMGTTHTSDKQPQDFPCGSAGKESTCNVGSIPGLGRSPGEGKGYPLQYSGLENSTDCVVHGVTKSQAWLSNFHSNSKNSTCNVKDLDLIPGLGRSPGEENGYPLQYSCLENSMDRGAWQAVAGLTVRHD